MGESGKALAADMGVSLEVLQQTHEEHYQAAKKTEKDPDGGNWPAYPSGKSWDEPSGKTGSGKKFYHNIIPGSAVATEEFYVAIITPVIHYCMGGLEIDTDSAVLSTSTGVAIPGLYAAGEVAGGVHGNNRLGGNSLLDCVVFGRVAGKAAAKYILGDDVKPTSLSDLSGGGLSGKVESSKLSGGSYEDNMNKSATSATSATPLLQAADRDVETGTLSRSKSIRAVPVAPKPAAPKESDVNFCVQLKNDFVWHVSKMDGCTWWILISTMVFLLCVAFIVKP